MLSFDALKRNLEHLFIVLVPQTTFNLVLPQSSQEREVI